MNKNLLCLFFLSNYFLILQSSFQRVFIDKNKIKELNPGQTITINQKNYMILSTKNNNDQNSTTETIVIDFYDEKEKSKILNNIARPTCAYLMTIICNPTDNNSSGSALSLVY